MAIPRLRPESRGIGTSLALNQDLDIRAPGCVMTFPEAGLQRVSATWNGLS
jgi:hypothetical protein